jgi:hypothetical protein
MIKYFYKTFFPLLIILLMFACENNNNVIVGTNPVIKNILTSSYWNMKDNRQYSVEVVTEDPQGYDNIGAVNLKISTSAGDLVFDGPLYDDGAYFNSNSGDKIANDGIYTNIFSVADITENPGNYNFTATAQDIDGNTAQPLEISVVLDYSARPLIHELSAPDTINSIYGQQYFYASVYDSSGLGNIENVYFTLEEENKEGVLKTYYMYNDGTNGDAVSNDSIFTYRTDSTFSIGRTGNYKLSFFAENLFSQKSIPVIRILYYTPEKPIIAKISMPDSLKRPEGYETVAKLIEVWVTDAQGQSDIDSVYFYSRKPDGELANNGNSIPLKDDGQNGDEIAGDGIYSFLMYISPSAFIGTYEFYFYARDKGDNISDRVTKTLEVY